MKKTTLKAIMLTTTFVVLAITAVFSQYSVTGRWSPIYNSSVVPVGAANLPDGRILGWSAYARTAFAGGSGQTYTTTFDPNTNSFSEGLVTNTGHDMFCPGTANLADGRIMITGGNNSEKTTIYNPSNNTYIKYFDKNIL